MELTPEERERIYQEEKTRLEVRQLLESQMNAKSATSTISNSERTRNVSGLSLSLSFIGVTLLVIGIATTIYFSCIFSVNVRIQMPVTLQQEGLPGSEVSSVNNIGLMADRQNGLIISGLSALIGIALLTTGLILGASNFKLVQLKVGIYSGVLLSVAVIALTTMANGGKDNPTVKRLTSSLRNGPDPNDAIAKTRLKQIGLAIAMYAQYHYEKFPNMDTSNDVQSEITQYGLHDDGSQTLVDAEAFIDPSSSLPWTFNTKFSGFSSMQNIEVASCEIIAYSPQPTSDGGRYCLFADGHYKKIDQAKWTVATTTTTIKANPELGFSTDYTLVPQ